MERDAHNPRFRREQIQALSATPSNLRPAACRGPSRSGMVRRMRRLLIMFVSWLLIIGHLGATLSLQGSCLPAWPPISPHFPQFGTQTAKNEAVGLYYLRARYMNAANGRFWNADSYEGSQSAPSSLHKYLYANADPISFGDASGFEIEPVPNMRIGTDVHVRFYAEMIVLTGAYGYYNLSMGRTFSDLKGQPGALRRPDALLVNGRAGLSQGSLFADQLFELKPSSAEENPAEATRQIGDYLTVLAGKGISAGNSRVLLPAETYLGNVTGDGGEQLRVYIYGSDTPGLVLYRLERELEDDRPRVPVPLPFAVRERREVENFERAYRPVPVGLIAASSAAIIGARILAPILFKAIETRIATSVTTRGY